jgi:hypothetical protein
VHYSLIGFGSVFYHRHTMTFSPRDFVEPSRHYRTGSKQIFSERPPIGWLAIVVSGMSA